MKTIDVLKYVILDSSEMVLYLKSKVNNLPEFYVEIDKVLKIIFENIIRENDAEMNLHYECMALFKDSIDEIYELDFEVIVDGIIKFGTVMLYELKKIMAYNGGELPYKYHGLLGNDIILIRTSA